MYQVKNVLWLGSMYAQAQKSYADATKSGLLKQSAYWLAASHYWQTRVAEELGKATRADAELASERANLAYEVMRDGGYNC